MLPRALEGRAPWEQAEFIRKSLRDEVSAEGVEALRKHGAYGPLQQLFPAEAEAWAKQAGVKAEDCVAFKLERHGQLCEVVLIRGGGSLKSEVGGQKSETSDGFRIVRCNNVKQMALPSTNPLSSITDHGSRITNSTLAYRQ